MFQIDIRTSARDPINHLKFSKIEIDAFSGKKDKWLNFNKLFLTYIHESDQSSNTNFCTRS